MRVFQRVWKDIQQGENIDLYVTVTLAIVLAILNVVGVAPSPLIDSITLAILALITIAILGNRHRLEVIIERTSLATDRILLEEFPPEFISELEKAKEVWLTGIHQSATMTAYYSLFEKKLKKGDNLRVVLVDPNGAACKMAAMRFPGRVSEDQERIRILSTLESLCELKKIAPSKLEIRTIDYLLEFGAFLLDPETPEGAAYLQRYTFKTLGGARKPKLIYRRRDGRWYDLVCAEIHALWENATPWDCQDSIPNQ
jgi:hypothetical protein